MSEWYEEFFGGLYAGILGGGERESVAPGEARLIRRLLRLRRGMRVLDVPCGMGRIAIPLAEAGMAVTGIDLMPAYLRRARRLARTAGVGVRFMQGDMRDIDFHGEFDAVVNWFGSFGYFDEEGNLAFARRVLAALRPGGRFLIETVNASWVAAHFRPRMESVIDGIRVTQRQRWDARGERVICDWAFERSGVLERRRSDMRLFNGTEIRRLLGQAGFGQVRLAGQPPLGLFTRHSKRLTAVARRPAT